MRFKIMTTNRAYLLDFNNTHGTRYVHDEIVYMKDIPNPSFSYYKDLQEDIYQFNLLHGHMIWIEVVK